MGVIFKYSIIDVYKYIILIYTYYNIIDKSDISESGVSAFSNRNPYTFPLFVVFPYNNLI